jgi:hypothetical protein
MLLSGNDHSPNRATPPMLVDGLVVCPACPRARGGPVCPTPPGQCYVEQPAWQERAAKRATALVVLSFRSRITRRPFIGGPVRHPPN